MRSYLAVLRRQAPVVVVAVLVTVGVALAASLTRAPLYEGRAEIVVQVPAPEARTATGSRQPSLNSSRLVPTEIRVLTSLEVRALATRTLGFSPRVTARQVGQTDVMELMATAATPQRARAIVRQYAAAYVDFRRAGATRDLLASSQVVEAELGRLRDRIDHAGGSEKTTLEAQYGLFGDVQVRLQVDAASALDPARLVTPTSGEISEVGPAVGAVGAWAGVVGLVLGLDLVLLFDFLDESVRSRVDLERAGNGLPVLGVIPGSRDVATLASRRLGSSPAAEAYRSLQTVLVAPQGGPPIRLLQITSAGPGEGRTTTVANLGLALAEAGMNVTLVDADLRRPGLHELFGLTNDAGLTSVAPGITPPSAALQKVTGQARLRVLTSGPPTPDLEELLSSRLEAVLESLVEGADIVLVDSPAVLAVGDALALSAMVDSVVLVAMSGSTNRHDVTRAVEHLLQVGAPLRGVVLNGVP